jgi:two-component system nitrate/nitrite response regulator NarL
MPLGHCRTHQDEKMKNIVICDTQPITVEGVRSLLSRCPDIEIVGSACSLMGGMEVVRSIQPDLVLIDKSFGFQAVMDWIYNLRNSEFPPSVILWGVSINEAEALRIMQGGAHGVVRKTGDLKSIMSCIRTVAGGTTWMDQAMFRDRDGQNQLHSNLTARESQVVELVEQGLKNKEIARNLGIRPGTVKIHLRHIFEKTGVRGRYGLALSGLKEKGIIPVVTM